MVRLGRFSQSLEKWREMDRRFQAQAGVIPYYIRKDTAMSHSRKDMTKAINHRIKIVQYSNFANILSKIIIL